MQLAGAPASVSVARRHVRSLLVADGVADETVDDVGLIVSELVANAVLHAGGPIALRVRWVGDGRSCLRLEVSDGSPSPPVERHYGTGAATGRGLSLVARLAVRWGFDLATDGSGKVVWAEVDVTDRTPAAHDGRVLLRPDRSSAPVVGDGSVPVRFLAVPVAAYLRLQEQNDAVLRELELLAFADSAPRRSPEVDDALERSRQFFNGVREGFRGPVLEASAAGRTTIDLDGSGSSAGLGPAREMLALFEDVERLAREGHLLIAPPDVEVARLRRWFVEELAAQVGGAPPTPYSL